MEEIIPFEPDKDQTKLSQNAAHVGWPFIRRGQYVD